MRRSALSSFFQRLIVATLPLAMACHDNAPSPADAAPQDLAIALPDLALATPDLYDSCEIDFPVTAVNYPPSKLPDGGFRAECIIGGACLDICPPGYMECCAPTPSDGGALLIDCSLPCLNGGRRPAGLASPAIAGAADGDYFATMAHLEAASVAAFRRLGRELRAEGAPARLVAATRRAARDEIRHARKMRAFAAQHGRRPAQVRVASFRRRSLEAIACENVAEGCVRETFSALVASWQARTARDRRFAAAMSAIASDETRHAELSWSVADFCASRLSAAARDRVREARDAAVDALAGELAQHWPATVAARVGLPDPASARRLFDASRRALWV